MKSAYPAVTSDKADKAWYAHRWPWLIISGPAIVVVASSISAWLAFSRQDQMVVDDYYNVGLGINQDLRRDAVASTLELMFNAHYNAISEQFQGALTSHGRPFASIVEVRFVHATDPKKDRILRAQLDRQGGFTLRLPLLERSRWSIVVEDQQHTWRLAGAWRWPQHGDVTLRADLAVAPS